MAPLQWEKSKYSQPFASGCKNTPPPTAKKAKTAKINKTENISQAVFVPAPCLYPKYPLLLAKAIASKIDVL